jgi:hypothetical protein
MAGVLSEAIRICGGEVGLLAAANIAPVSNAVSSKSLFVMEPVGLAEETKCCCICAGKGARHTKYLGVGVVTEGGKTQQPPMPCREALTVARIVGWRGIRVWMGTGWWWAESTNSSQSRRIALMMGRSRRRDPFASFNACWSKEKQCMAPYKAGVVLRKMPNI